MTARRIHAYILLLLVSLIWGIASVVIKFTLDGIDAFPFLTYRFLISLVISVFMLSTTPVSWKKYIKHAPEILIYSLFATTGALGLLFLGLERASVLQMSLIVLLGPLMMEVAGVVFLQERFTKREKIGTAIAISGTLFTILEPLLADANGHDLLGNVFLSLYLAVDVIGLVILKRLLRSKLEPMVLTNIAFIVGFFSALAVTLVSYSLTSLISMVYVLPLKYHLGVWYMAVFSGTIAYILRAKGQKSIEVGEGALFGYLTPLFSAPLAVVFLKEELSTLFIVGGAIIAIGVMIAEYKPKKR